MLRAASLLQISTVRKEMFYATDLGVRERVGDGLSEGSVDPGSHKQRAGAAEVAVVAVSQKLGHGGERRETNFMLRL